MAEEDKTPASIEDVKKLLFRRAWIWMIEKPLWLKCIVGIAGLAALVMLARLGLFGKPLQGYSKLIVPWVIPGVDPAVPVIPMSLSFEVEDSMGRRTGKLGGPYWTGDHLYISFKAGVNCWVSVFRVDAKGTHPIFRKKLAPSLVESEQDYPLDFRLNDTVGDEVYYVIAAPTEFSFEDQIESLLQNVFPEGHSKGPASTEYELALPGQFTQRHIYFEHLPGPPASLDQYDIDSLPPDLAIQEFKVFEGGNTESMYWIVPIYLQALYEIDIYDDDNNEWISDALSFDCRAVDPAIHLEGGELTVEDQGNGTKRYTYYRVTVHGYGSSVSNLRIRAVYNGNSSPWVEARPERSP